MPDRSTSPPGRATPAVEATPTAAATPAAEATPAAVHVGLLAVQLIFGGFHVIARGVLAHLDPLALAGIRLALATPLLLLLAWRHDRVLPARRDLPYLALLGFLGVFANQILFLQGLARTTATNASILMPSIPVFAAAVGALLGIERIGWQRAFGIALTVAGALVILDPTHFTFAGDSGGHAADEITLGNLLVLTNCLSYAAFLVVQRPILERLPWRTVIAWAFFFGGLGVVAVATPKMAAVEPAALPAGVFWGIAYIVLLPTVLSYSLNTWAIRRSSATLAAAYTTLQPLFTGGLAALFLAERFGWRQAVGFVLIALGLWRVSVKRG